jgi:hypothetical protein
MQAKVYSALPLFLFVLAAFAVRLHFAGIYAESWDAVDFALALNRYDIFAMQPHFPGYPLYIAAALVFKGWADDPVRALTWLAACVGSLSLLPFAYLAKRILRKRTAVWLACIWFAVNPLVALAHVQPMSEAFGLFAVLLLLAAALHADQLRGTRLVLAASMSALLYALLLGIRISYFPLGMILLYPLWLLYRERISNRHFWLQGLFVMLVFVWGMMAWLLPTAATEGGLIPYLRLGFAFTAGHFTDWGGTAFSEGSPWWERLAVLLIDRLLYNGLLGMDRFSEASSLPSWMFWLALIFHLVLLLVWLFAWRVRNRRWIGFISLAVLPYALWVFLGQNSEKARHLLPLLPWVLLSLTSGWITIWEKLRGRSARIVLAACSLMVLAGLGFRQGEVLHRHLAPPPAVQLVDYVATRYPAEGTLLYTWEEQRLFDYYAPPIHTERLKSYAYFVQSVLLHREKTERFLLTNAVLDGFGNDHPLRGHVREIARFSADPFLYPTYHTVILYELSPAYIIAAANEQNR